jgi:hypothetical protein
MDMLYRAGSQLCEYDRENGRTDGIASEECVCAGAG